MKIKQKTISKILNTRNTVECLGCFNVDKCNYMYSLSVFEKNHKLELDCWCKKTHSNLFFTGLHKPMFIQVDHPITHNKITNHIWLHVLSNKHTLFLENNLLN
jgi:hypothetical protein